MSALANEPRKAWEQVVDWVQQRILSGELTVGSRLPAERDLAVIIGVSRPAVREAVRTLQASGVLSSTVGAGTAGGTTISGVPQAALTRLIQLHVALAHFPTADVTEVRVALERLSTRLASQRAKPDDLAHMRDCLDIMDDDEIDIDRFNDYDTELHLAIARAAGNQLAADLTVAIRESMRIPIFTGLNALEDWTEIRSTVRKEHRMIVNAVAAGQPDEAANLVEHHIRNSYATMTSLHDH